jgi:multidrug efflux pump subunit AcrA (membrane-fusion protein)
MKRSLLAIIGMVVLFLAIALLGQRWFTRTDRDLAPAALGAAPGREEEQVVARGTLIPVRWKRLGFASSGMLAKLDVSEGSQVTSGQELASLETQALELAVALAANEFEAQQDTLRALDAGSSSAEFVAAQASYDAAVAAYERIKSRPSPEETAIAEADLKKAEAAVRRAQGAYDAVRNLPDIGARHEAVQLQEVTLDYERAKAQYALAVAKPDQAELKQAGSQVAAARARLDALPAELRATQSAVVRAKLDLQRAQLELAQATLYAPLSGTVTTLNVQPGDMVSAGSPVLTLADLSELQVELQDLDEWGAANVRLNQSVDLTIPSLENLSLRGRLVSVATEPTISAAGAVFYKAIVALEKQVPALRWGMSVTVRFPRPTGRAEG